VSKPRRSNPVVTLKDVHEGILANNRSKELANPLSAKNPANFMKDVIRNVDTSNRIWPKGVFEAGYTHRCRRKLAVPKISGPQPRYRS
jgi:hypothetical protein